MCRTEWEVIINPTLWFAFGAALGLAAFKLAGSPGTGYLVEDLLVGVFAAFIGGEVVVPKLLSKAVADGPHLSAIALALGVAIVGLIALHVFRHKMAPEPQRRRRSRA